MNKLKEKKEHIKLALNEFIKYDDVMWSKDSVDKLKDFTLNGKMIRGSLFLRTYEIITNKNEHVKVALALELSQSAILMHDDVMDKDEFRRGKKTIHKQYQNLVNNDHYGHSMAICLGDIGFFSVFKLIPECISHIYSDNMIKCAYGQMQDIHFSYSNIEPTIDEIIDVYKYKTARYTFSMPMMLAAKLAGKDVDIFSELGENLGIIFQIIDDDIGMFGDIKEIGKTPGSDIIENKKTLHRYFLLKKYPELKKYFGKEISKQELELIKQKALEIKPQIKKILENYQHKVNQLIEKLPCDKNFFQELSNYNINRLK